MGKAGTVALNGNLWFTKDTSKFLGGDRIAMLEKIDELGSITKAAKAVGVSYKTAWEMVNQINNLAAVPLVDRATGGKGGGVPALRQRAVRCWSSSVWFRKSTANF